MAMHSYYVYTVRRNSNIHMDRLRKVRSLQAAATLGVSLSSPWIPQTARNWITASQSSPGRSTHLFPCTDRKREHTLPQDE